MRKLINLRKFFFVFICINIFLASWYLLHGDISFNTDIARDFLLLENVAQTHKPTLIGPRSGGISGYFHGPLWLYINLPAYIIGGGDPVIVGWFWLLLIIISLVSTYFVSKKVFDEKTALFATFLLSIFSITYAPSLFNPFGAVILSPLFFYTFYLYVKKNKIVYLVASLFLVGIMVQFQIAFAGPILLLMTVFLIYYISKKRLFLHFVSYFVLLIPFSTYILFEVRHQFLQTKAIVTFITHGSTEQFSLLKFLESRGESFIFSFTLIPSMPLILQILLLLIYSFLIFKTSKMRNLKNKVFYLFFLYFFIGYWLLAFLFKGTIWSYYTWPFLPLIVIIFSSCHRFLSKPLFYSLFICISLMNLIPIFSNTILKTNDSIGKDATSWIFNKNLAKTVFDDASGDFGYYIYTPDEYGYSPRYAMDYLQRSNKKKAFPYTKKEITYLLIAPPPSDRPYLNGNWWIKHRVNINKKAQKNIYYANGFKIEKYILLQKEQNIQSDPTIINGLFFR